MVKSKKETKELLPSKNLCLFLFISHANKRKFLMAYALTGRLVEAERLSGIDRRNHSNWKRDDPEYVLATEHARQYAADTAEDEVFRRGILGFNKPLSYEGKLTGDVVREFSDNLAMFWLKGARPERYRERYDDSGKGPEKIQINIITYAGKEGQGGAASQGNGHNGPGGPGDNTSISVRAEGVPGPATSGNGSGDKARGPRVAPKVWKG